MTPAKVNLSDGLRVSVDGNATGLPISDVYREDIERTVSLSEIPWETMKGKSVIVTGATGLIGNALIRTLHAANEKYGLELRITGYGRSRSKGEALSRECGILFR